MTGKFIAETEKYINARNNLGLLAWRARQQPIYPASEAASPTRRIYPAPLPGNAAGREGAGRGRIREFTLSFRAQGAIDYTTTRGQP